MERSLILAVQVQQVGQDTMLPVGQQKDVREGNASVIQARGIVEQLFGFVMPVLSLQPLVIGLMSGLGIRTAIQLDAELYISAGFGEDVVKFVT